jgi:hypothetical protein
MGMRKRAQTTVTAVISRKTKIAEAMFPTRTTPMGTGVT